MNAAVVHSYAEPPRYAAFDDPAPGDGEILVTVAAAGLHPIVRSLAQGAHYGSTGILPLVPGVDGVGRLPDGARVYFGATHPPFGTFAERCLCRPAMCLPIPAALDDVTVAAIMNPGMSSYGALTQRIQFAAGESVLILGATGSAGQLAVQIAKRLGARRVVAAGRNPQALESLKSLGADALISLDQDRDVLAAALREEIAGHKIDVVLDYVWGAPAEATLAAIAQKGLDASGRRIRYIEIGSMAGQTISLPGATLRSSGLELVGSGFGSVSLEKIFQALALFLEEAARQPFHLKAEAVPLREVESLWDAPGDARLVFQP